MTDMPHTPRNIEELKELERRSSAVTLSDMEMFVFPELLYSLMLANIMSPELWRWRDDPWFKDFGRKSPAAKINRLRQFIMDHYAFNLDLDTWGLTTKERELARFAPFIDHDALAQSNALFGYEGDKYYFDIDIRRHFGLDKYAGNVIPYWKTETVEAMGAFTHIPGRYGGAGECVSLSALYAAALFVVLGIPLEKIHLLATPLHSQNFIDVGDGVITNNRRIVTKNMWFNGTALSAQARRSMEHERITIVAHATGTIHLMYPRATISRAAYSNFRAKLGAYLSTNLTPDILGNFLRQAPDFRERFVIRHRACGRDLYLPLSRAFEYEKDVPHKVTDDTLHLLLDGVENSEFMNSPCDRCVVLNDIADYLRDNPVDIGSRADLDRLAEKFGASRLDGKGAVDALVKFCRIIPRMPDEAEKTFESGGEALGVEPSMTREEIVARLDGLRGKNEYCELAFHAYRDLSRVEAAPFIKAATERNPVCVEAAARHFPGDESLAEHVANLRAESIYEGPGRLAQPDEVWNYGTGDGLERAIMLAVILAKRNGNEYVVETEPGSVRLTQNGKPAAQFTTVKRITEKNLRIVARARVTEHQ